MRGDDGAVHRYRIVWQAHGMPLSHLNPHRSALQLLDAEKRSPGGAQGSQDFMGPPCPAAGLTWAGDARDVCRLQEGDAGMQSSWLRAIQAATRDAR